MYFKVKLLIWHYTVFKIALKCVKKTRRERVIIINIIVNIMSWKKKYIIDIPLEYLEYSDYQ